MGRASEPRAGLSLDEAHRQIAERWFVWTAAGLTVHPVTRTGPDDATAAATLHLRVSRHSAAAEITLSADGSTDIAVQRPGAGAVTRTHVRLDSLQAFAPLLDRVVELITWSGVPKDPTPQTGVAPTAASNWVAGYDGAPYRDSAAKDGGT